MECEAVRTALIDRALTDLDDLMPHISSCPRCTRDLERLQRLEEVIADDLESFANAGDLDAALALALPPEIYPIHPPVKRSWPTMFAVIAAAALTALVISPPLPDPSPATRVLTPVPLTVDEASEPGALSAPELRALPKPRALPQQKEVAQADETGLLPQGTPVVSDDVPLPHPEPVVAAMPSLQPPAEDPCGLDLIAFEAPAMAGKLDEETIDCLERAIVSGIPQRAERSHLLMVNAWSYRDKAEWERLIARHLGEIDPSDPDLSYKYALHLSRSGVSRAEEVISWSEVALSGRAVWTGETLERRVSGLHKVRAAASLSLWGAAEGAGDKGMADKYRSLTRDFAKEWYGSAERGSKDASAALQICKSADPSCSP